LACFSLQELIACTPHAQRRRLCPNADTTRQLLVRWGLLKLGTHRGTVAHRLSTPCTASSSTLPTPSLWLVVLAACVSCTLRCESLGGHRRQPAFRCTLRSSRVAPSVLHHCDGACTREARVCTEPCDCRSCTMLVSGRALTAHMSFATSLRLHRQ
jgi:hypothetical protein